MKKFLFFFLLAFFFIPVLSCLAEEQNTFDVRKVRWGMSKDKVLKSELPNKIYRAQKKLHVERCTFNEVIFGYKCSIDYIIENNKLIEVNYIFNTFDDEHTYDKLKYIIKNILDKKYKKPESKELSEEERLLKEFNEESSKIFNMYNYENERTNILLRYDFDIISRGVMVIYSDRQYEIIQEEEYKKKKEQERKKFEKEASQF